MEILSPAGNFEGLMAAINAGADAVYFGGNRFGARAYADNFTDEEIIKGIHLAHSFGVKMYLTVNTLIKEREFKDVIDYIDKFYKEGLDACIVQDMGLISVFKKYFPNMELHVSTQAFVTGVESVRFFKELGADRVVLARELSLKEIKEIKSQVDIELETFIHGAMCYSYSGDCLFSSCVGGRSGNRGRCAGPCRQPYICSEYETVPKFMLSMKDQCTVNILPRLIDAGIDSLKIEGRMKKPEYTAFVTSIYKKYAQIYKENPAAFKVSDKDIDDLKHIYLRSETGYGYYENRNGKEMISLDNPGYSGNDEALMKVIREKYIENNRKIGINISACLLENEPMQITVYKDDTSVTVTGVSLERSLNSPATETDIKMRLQKLGNTEFVAEEVDVFLSDNVFVPVKALNELRREAINLFAKEYSYVPAKTKNTAKVIFRKHADIDLSKPIVTALNLDQYLNLKGKADEIYLFLNSEAYEELCAYDSNGDGSEDLFESAQKGYYIDMPYVLRNSDLKSIEKIIRDKRVKGIIVNNLETLALSLRLDFSGIIIIGPSLYCWNKEALSFYGSIGDRVISSYELSSHEINDLGSDELCLAVYGRIPLMQTANCIMKTMNTCLKGKGPEFLHITDRKGYTFPVHRNCKNCYNTIYNSLPLSLHEEVRNCKIDISNLFLSFTTESGFDAREILDAFLDKKNDYQVKEYTKSYYKRGVE